MNETPSQALKESVDITKQDNERLQTLNQQDSSLKAGSLVFPIWFAMYQCAFPSKLSFHAGGSSHKNTLIVSKQTDYPKKPAPGSYFISHFVQNHVVKQQ
eukprot:3557175-Rhodomonas_salina.1